MEANLKDLTQVIPHKWRVANLTARKDKFNCLAYIDARDVMDLLDKVVGPENWRDDYFLLPGKTGMFCKLEIKVNGEWIWKVDTGTSGDIEEEKSEVSDALKRAAVKWGIGRFLYDLETKYVAAKASYKDAKGNDHYDPVDETGNKIWNLTDYFCKTGKYAKTAGDAFNGMNDAIDAPDRTLTTKSTHLKKPAPYSTGETAKPCSDCSTACTVAETGYSTKTFGRPLCRNCQAKAKGHDVAPF